MKSKHIFLGFAIVLLPSLISAFWAFHSGREMSSRVQRLNSLFPLLENINGITIRINDLKDDFIQTALAPDEAGYQNCQNQVVELDNEFKRLMRLSSDAKIEELYQLSNDYCNKSLDLIRAIYNGDEENALMEQGSHISVIASQMLENLKDFREETSAEYSEGLAAMNQASGKTSLITSITSIFALSFGIFLAYWLARWFSQTNQELRETHAVLELRFSETTKTNALLEKEVIERKRAEEAVRNSLKAEEALSKVSKLFTSSHSPNLRQVVKLLGNVVGSHLSFLGLIQNKDMMVEKIIEWTEGVNTGRLPDVLDINLAKLPIWVKALMAGKKVEVKDIRSMPDEAFGERRFAESLGIRSILLMPVSREDKFLGYMGFAQISETRKWNEDDLRLLRVGCEMLSNYLARKEAEDKLKYDAFHDNLTSLPNRALVMERLVHSLQRLDRRPNALFAVLFIDLDRFKPINDSLGHHAGDLLLKEVSRRLLECVRQADTVARLGGDEFITVLEELEQAQEAEQIAERILKKLSEPFAVCGQTVYISCSIGISLLDQSYENPQDVLRDADIAMYRAKLEGKSRFVVFHKSMQARTLSTFKLASDLRQALLRDEFELHYQPVISLSDGKIKSFEALVRWNHPELGRVSPVEFIPIAEECGLMGQLGTWVLNTACRQNKVWHDAGYQDLSIAVNVSARQFYEETLCDQIRNILDETGLHPKHLKVELTEGILMENIEGNIQMMQDLKNLGIQILIDDFGTGYSSLSYLKRFPLSTLKIDQSFIRDVPSGTDDTAITSTIIAMAQSLNLSVIAEGVENREQLAFLKGKGCHQVQGYFFSKPLDVDEASVFLSESDLRPIIQSLS